MRSPQPIFSLFPALVLGCVATLASLSARADLMINPTRIVFENNQRSAQIDVINDGTTPATYRLNVVNRRMTDSGEFQSVTTPVEGEHFAGSMLVFSPRQIVLQPGTQQLVRIAVRKPADLPPGEYRSHLSFDKVADPSLTNAIENQVKPNGSDLGVTIAALIGVSIPVIVRQGQTEATVTISQMALEKPKSPGQPAIVALQLNRIGNRSVYGDLTATFRTDAGEEKVVAQAGGVAVYTPNALRRARLTVQAPPGTVLSGGALRVTYRQRTDDGGKMLAESTLQIP